MSFGNKWIPFCNMIGQKVLIGFLMVDFSFYKLGVSQYFFLIKELFIIRILDFLYSYIQNEYGFKNSAAVTMAAVCTSWATVLTIFLRRSFNQNQIEKHFSIDLSIIIIILRLFILLHTKWIGILEFNNPKIGLIKNCLFRVMVQKNRVGRLGKKIDYFFTKMCVLCMFYVDWELKGWKKLWGRDFLRKQFKG